MPAGKKSKNLWKPQGSPNYHYEFQIDLQRFRGTTGCKNCRDAQVVLELSRDEAIKKIKLASSGLIDPTIDDALKIWWETTGKFRKDEAACQRAMKWIRAHLSADLPMSELTRTHVQLLVSTRRQEEPDRKGRPVNGAKKTTLAAQTVNHTFGPLQAAWLAARDSKCPVCPIKWSKILMKVPVGRNRYMKPNEQAAIAAVLPAHYHPIWLFGKHSGLRISNCCGLTWGQVDFYLKQINVVVKGGKSVSLPFSDAIENILRQQLKSRQVGCDWVFPSVKDPFRGWTRNYLSRVFHKAAVRAGVLDLCWNQATRHTAGTLTTKANGNLAITKQQLHHSNVKTTMRYIYVDDEDVRNAMNKADSLSLERSDD